MDKPLQICNREEKVVFCEIHFTGCFRVLSMLPSQAAGEISGIGEFFSYRMWDSNKVQNARLSEAVLC